MPRYKFRWSNLPGDMHSAMSTVPDRRIRSSAKPGRLCCDTWLKHDNASRDWIVTALRQTRHEGGTLTKRNHRLEYLGNLHNAKNLRAIVLEALIATGAIELPNDDP